MRNLTKGKKISCPPSLPPSPRARQATSGYMLKVHYCCYSALPNHQLIPQCLFLCIPSERSRFSSCYSLIFPQFHFVSIVLFLVLFLKSVMLLFTRSFCFQPPLFSMTNHACSLYLTLFCLSDIFRYFVKVIFVMK